MKRLILIILLFSSVVQAAYTPFPVYDMRSGLNLSTAAWLLPQDGFTTLNNCHLKRGVLEKRQGYSFFGQLCHINTTTKAPTLKTDPVMGLWNYYSGSTEQLMVMDAKRICKYLTSAVVNKTITAFADGGGGLVTVTSAAHGFSDDDIVTISATTNYDGTFRVQNKTTNTFQITDTWVSDDATGSVSQEKFLDLTRNKIRFKHASKQNWTDAAENDVVYGGTSTATGTIEAVVVDTGTFAGTNANGTIIFKNGTVSGTFVTGEELQDNSLKTDIIGEADGAATDGEFSGDNTNFFWVDNWREVAYITNNKDTIQKYNGTNLTQLNIDLDVEGGPDNDVTRCRLIFSFKSRLVLFDVTEKGTTYRQRARWCDINDPDTWKNADYIDADTEEWIIAADFLGDDLIVFCERSVWTFSYTSDPYAPFRWDRIDAVEGCYASMSLLPFSDEIIGVGATQIVGCDGREAYTIGEKIPDFTLSWNQESVSYCYGLVIEELKQAWETYTTTDATANADGNKYPNKVLVLNYEDDSWATYTMPIHSLGYSSLESDLTWNDVTDAWEDIDWSWDSKEIQGGYPINLFGGQNGKIYKINDTGADDGSDIEFEAISGRWNPYLLEGKRARLGWINFLVDVDADASFDVLSYIDTDNTAFQTKTITCTARDGAEDRVWHRVYVNAVARFHRIKLTNYASSNRPRIHCIMPFFEPAGSLY